MWPLVMFSNCFKIVFTTLSNQTRLRYVYFITVILILYHYTIRNGYTRQNICSAWFLDIRISTCFLILIINIFFAHPSMVA